MKPTREQILAEPAGPRLNRWVGEYVMGCREEQSDDDLYDLIILGGVNQVDFCEPGACWSAVPKYSENIASAWQVVEKMLASGWGGFGWDGFEKGQKWLVGFGHTKIEAETMPLAISKASLLAALENQ